MRRAVILFFNLILFLLCAADLFAQLRSFNDIFPNMSAEDRFLTFSNEGYVKSSQKSGFIIYGNDRGCGLDQKIVGNILSSNPGYFVESISIIQQKAGTVSFLDIYNALGKIRDLKGRLYESATRGKEIPLFEDATRIISDKQTTAVPDPAPAYTLPKTDTIHVRLKDVNFGNTFYRAEMSLLENGISYTMTNSKNITYLFVPVMKEGRFIARLYIEPIAEGVLMYSVAGADISDFVSSKIHVDSAITKRLAVITSWASDGIRKR
jgi:hypothetical protein